MRRAQYNNEVGDKTALISEIVVLARMQGLDVTARMVGKQFRLYLSWYSGKTPIQDLVVHGGIRAIERRD